MTVKKITKGLSFFEKYHKSQEEWEYIEDPTYSRSIGSHVCMTCSKFDYFSQASCGSILCCNCHQKLIFHGQHLTHSCEFYKKKANFAITNKLYNKCKAA